MEHHHPPTSPTSPGGGGSGSVGGGPLAHNTATNASTSITNRLALKNPALSTKLAQMSLALAPLVQLTTGAVHPSFPRTLLAFWLLTDDQLDQLAHFYHQRTPCAWTAHYPCPVRWRPGMGLEEKRRKLGRFIGLRGCETPAWEVVPAEVAGRLGRSEEEIAREARRRRGEEEVRRKMGWF
ncbi:hypothetical protein BT67DRAFT_444287 [Trichocladium antarcticum]|uniref:Beta-xylosidase n=1 Tax=Trichocladium antarcticum TaxID=1450529 RepID=A0AAN6ZBI4_9PEZI|nr:hypothetical protein BT67DRAFT_444287 [Trichocladium antarcticum]